MTYITQDSGKHITKDFFRDLEVKISTLTRSNATANRNNVPIDVRLLVQPHFGVTKEGINYS